MPWPGSLSFGVTLKLSHFQKHLEPCQSFQTLGRGVPAQQGGGSVPPQGHLGDIYAFALVSEEHEGVQGTEGGGDAVAFGNGMDVHGCVTFLC